MFVGEDFKNAIAIGTKEEIYSNLDNEFYTILEFWRWFKTGLMPLTLNDIPYWQAVGIRYLIEVNDDEPKAVHLIQQG